MINHFGIKVRTIYEKKIFDPMDGHDFIYLQNETCMMVTNDVPC
jgi:hypothetical protein